MLLELDWNWLNWPIGSVLGVFCVEPSPQIRNDRTSLEPVITVRFKPKLVRIGQVDQFCTGARSSPNKTKKSGKQMESHHPRRCIKARRSEWKEKLREGCLSRVRENRRQLLWKIRLAREATEPKEIAVSAFEQIISDELQKSKQSCHGDSQSAFIPDNDDALWDYEPSGETRKLDKDEYEEILLEMERLLHDDIQAELKQRDAALLEDYEKTCALEEESVAAALFEHLKIQEQNGGLFCPICRKGYLNQQRQFIYCECCQLKLDTQNDEVDLQVLQKHLSDVLEEHHGRGCKAQPKFCVESRFEISALFMKCSVCEAFELVL